MSITRPRVSRHEIGVGTYVCFYDRVPLVSAVRFVIIDADPGIDRLTLSEPLMRSSRPGARSAFFPTAATRSSRTICLGTSSLAIPIVSCWRPGILASHGRADPSSTSPQKEPTLGRDYDLNGQSAGARDEDPVRGRRARDPHLTSTWVDYGCSKD